MKDEDVENFCVLLSICEKVLFSRFKLLLGVPMNRHKTRSTLFVSVMGIFNLTLSQVIYHH